MKKVTIVYFTALLNFVFFSCTPEQIVEDEVQVLACCGDGEDIPPPPPPPRK